MSHRVEIVCHRGANEYAPENTYAAAQYCIEWGMDYVEIDVDLSADGVHYVFHGPRLERTTNGIGLISETSSAVIDQLDAGSWFGPEFAGERVPRLDAFLHWIRGKAKVYLDLKVANLPEVVEMIRTAGMADECFWWTESDTLAREMRLVAPEIPLKINVFSVADVVRAHEEYGAALVEVRLKDMSRQLVDACRQRGIKVMIYHPRKEEGAFRQILRWGVEMVNVDHGDLFLRVMEAYEAELAQGKVNPTSLPRAKRAILCMLDGCRADAIEVAETPVFDRLRREGAWTLQGRAVMPSVTLPCHTTLFHSQMPEEHGVNSNDWTPSPLLAPSFITMLRDAGYESALFYTWEQLRDLAPPDKVDKVFYRRLSYEALDELQANVIATITRLKPTFSFVYWEAPDALGHLYGWMSASYLKAIHRADAMVGALIEALAANGDLEETLIIVMADHGGHGRGHGTEQPEDMTIPWLIWGPGIRKGHEIKAEVRLMDVAPTLLYTLGVAPPAAWRGQVIHEILEDG